jgi:hypothetical protein
MIFSFLGAEETRTTKTAPIVKRHQTVLLDGIKDPIVGYNIMTALGNLVLYTHIYESIKSSPSDTQEVCEHTDLPDDDEIKLMFGTGDGHN